MEREKLPPLASNSAVDGEKEAESRTAMVPVPPNGHARRPRRRKKQPPTATLLPQLESQSQSVEFWSTRSQTFKSRAARIYAAQRAKEVSSGNRKKGFARAKPKRKRKKLIPENLRPDLSKPRPKILSKLQFKEREAKRAAARAREEMLAKAEEERRASEAEAAAAAREAARVRASVAITVICGEKMKEVSGAGIDTWTGQDVTDVYCRCSTIPIDEDEISNVFIKDSARTKVCVDGGSQPAWGETITLATNDAAEERLLVQIFDSDDALPGEGEVSSDDPLGQFVVHLNLVHLSEQHKDIDGIWYDLDNNMGRIKLHLKLVKGTLPAEPNIWTTTRECDHFTKFFDVLARSPNGSQVLEAAWKGAGGNNKHCSFAEVNAWIRRKVRQRLYKVFKPCFIRAFLDAADSVTPNKRIEAMKTSMTDDYVQKNEFRLLCSYLVVYSRMFDAFAFLDGRSAGVTEKDDRHVTMIEWRHCWSEVKGHGFRALADVNASNVEESYAALGPDSDGSISLDRWCASLKDREIEAGTAMGQLWKHDSTPETASEPTGPSVADGKVVFL